MCLAASKDAGPGAASQRQSAAAIEGRAAHGLAGYVPGAVALAKPADSAGWATGGPPTVLMMLSSRHIELAVWLAHS